MSTRRLLMGIMGLAGWLVLALEVGSCMAEAICPGDPNCMALTRIEADYIVACQDANSVSPAYGAINNVHGKPTWVVPSENAMAILGLVMASEILQDPDYLACAQWAADYLVSVQDPNDGAWCNHYKYATPFDPNKSPRHTAEVMIALNKLGYDPNRYDAMRRGAEYLMSCQAVGNKGGRDDGLLGGGKDSKGIHQGWRWTHDNAYAYWALRVAEVWATKEGEVQFATDCASIAQGVLNGINAYLYDENSGVWHVAIDGSGFPQWESFIGDLPSWIQYSPQMLDLPAYGVNSIEVGQWIQDTFQQADGSCIDYEWENGQLKTRKFPGYSFQAALCWFDTGQAEYADAAVEWCIQSGLWKTSPGPGKDDPAGGWIDWEEVEPNPGGRPDSWQRFIDTSFYAIAAFHGGYDFRISERSD